MDLIFSKDSPRNATLALPTGQPVYELSTPDRLFHQEPTTIKKFQPGSSAPRDIGLIELHRFQENVVDVGGKSVLPQSPGVFKRGKTFTSSNGQQYTWKRKSRAALLTDKSRNTVAFYEEQNLRLFSRKDPSPAKLSISPAAVELADEIVGTFAYIEQQERKSRQGAAAGAAGSAGATC